MSGPVFGSWLKISLKLYSQSKRHQIDHAYEGYPMFQDFQVEHRSPHILLQVPYTKGQAQLLD